MVGLRTPFAPAGLGQPQGLQYKPLSPGRGVLAGGLQGLGQYLLALGTGQPQNAMQAFQGGLQGFEEGQYRRQQQADYQEDREYRRTRQQQEDADRAEKKAKAAEAEAKWGAFQTRLTDDDPTNDPTGIKDILPYLPPEMQMQMAPDLFAEGDAPKTVGGMQWNAATKAFEPITGYTEQQKAIAEAGRAPQQGDGGPKTSLVPFYTTDKDGNVHMFQPTASGVPVEVQLPEGMSPTKPLSFQDLGTSILPVQPLGGAQGTPIKKDVAGVESEKVAGKGQGEAIEAYRSMSSKMPGLETVVAKLDGLSENATYTKGGQVLDTAIKELGMDPRDAAIARSEYISIVDNQVLPLLRDTFGAAFTQKEGDSLRATLGDPNASPKEKQAILRSFIEQKRRDIEALALRAAAGDGQETPAGGNIPPPPPGFEPLQ